MDVSDSGSGLCDGTVVAEIVLLDNYLPDVARIYRSILSAAPSTKIVVVSDSMDTIFSLSVPRHSVAIRREHESIRELVVRILGQSRVTRRPSASDSDKQTTEQVTLDRLRRLRKRKRQTRSHVIVTFSVRCLRQLLSVLSMLPESFPYPVLLSQSHDSQSHDSQSHDPRSHYADEGNHGQVGRDEVDISETLRSASLALSVHEAFDGARPGRGQIWVAPPNYSIEFADVSGRLGLSPQHDMGRDDVLLESAARAFGQRIVAVDLTQSPDHRHRGHSQISAAGGNVLVLDELDSHSSQSHSSKYTTATEVVDLNQVVPALLALTPRGLRINLVVTTDRSGK